MRIVARRASMSEIRRNVPVLEEAKSEKRMWSAARIAAFLGTAMIRGYSSMTSIPIVLVIGFAAVSLGKPPMMAITLFLDRDRAQTRDNPATGLGKTPGETANHGDHALSGRDVAETRDNRDLLGKILGETANHGDRAFFDHNHAKPNNKPVTAWEKFLGKPPIMAISLCWITIVPKLATIRRRLGKTPGEIANHGDSQDRLTPLPSFSGLSPLLAPMFPALEQRRAQMTRKIEQLVQSGGDPEFAKRIRELLDDAEGQSA